MKIKILVLVCILTFSVGKINAQITLEHTFDSTGVPYFYCTNIDSNESKYVFMNSKTNSFSLYNMDMSP